MKLQKFQVQLYRNVVDSNVIPLQGDVTCLVGKNESGKTTLLQALYSLNPAYPEAVRVNIVQDYPRWRKVRDERQSSLEHVCPITTYFSLEKADLELLGKQLPLRLPPNTLIVATRNYDGKSSFSLKISEADWIALIIEDAQVAPTIKEEASNCETLQQLADFFENQQSSLKDKRTKTFKTLYELSQLAKQASQLCNSALPKDIQDVLQNRLPRFFYFSEYSSLPGRIDLTELLNKKGRQLNDSERTSLSLLKLVGVEGKEFMEGNFESRVAELEAAANEISNQVFEYWTQNTDLIVRLVGDSATVPSPQGQQVEHRYVDIRLHDLRHQMTTNFETRSTGFQWFFSFITAFSEFAHDEPLIILLDEPGLGLHARAQADLLRYIDEKLASGNQVVYTTHSPFMVSPKQLERVRLVEDLTTRQNPDVGCKVSTDVLSVQGDTLFPLQAALGYDLAQNIFVGGHNLVVEGPADLLYLLVLSDHLDQLGKECLNEKWSIVPVGGIDKVPTFVALLGTHLDVTVFIDAMGAPNQRLLDMVDREILASHRLLSVEQVTGKSRSDLEDLFEDTEYLSFYNEAYNTNLSLADLRGSDSIVSRIERHVGDKFDHLRPATAFLKDKENHLANLSSDTLARFEELFKLINATLPR